MEEEKVCNAFGFNGLNLLVHFDRFKRADFDANLAAHTNGDVNVEDLWIKLRLAHVIGLLVVALDDVNALWRTFFLANLTRHAAQARLLIFAIVNQKRKVAIVFRKRNAL